MKNKRWIIIILLFFIAISIYVIHDRSSYFPYIKTSDKNYNMDESIIDIEGKCFWEDTVKIKENIQMVDEPISDNNCIPSGYLFYVGYFKELQDAIDFGEVNYQAINEFIYKNSDISHMYQFSYRIDTICDKDLQGYLVAFDAIDHFIEFQAINGFVCTIDKSYINNIHNFINETPNLKYLRVFNIFDVYLGNIQYMHFN